MDMRICVVCGKEKKAFKGKRCPACVKREYRGVDKGLSKVETMSITDSDVPASNVHTSVGFDLPGDTNHSRQFDDETLQSIRQAHVHDRTKQSPPDNSKYQPENGDIMAEGQLLKGWYEKGTGTDRNARDYIFYMRLGKYKIKKADTPT